MDRLVTGAALCAVSVFGALLVGCTDPAPGHTYFERNIQPILTQKCAGNTSGCHSTNPEDPFKFAAGNFDVTTFANVQKRRDLLAPFGVYPYAPLLIKAVGPNALTFAYGGKQLPITVQHSGGAVLEPGSDAFLTLQQWIQNGATENGLKPATPPQTGTGTCSTAVPSGFDPTTYLGNANFAAFKSTVQPIITAHNCNAGSCHGAPQSDFYITCGADDTQLAFNFSQAWAFVNNPVADSQILRVPLAVGAGGRGHTGGDQFSSTDDPDYLTITTWATAVGKLDFAAGDTVKQFFADNVQPILLQRGCSFQACHSPQATNDFKLRSGTQGFFSAVALGKNYDLLRNDFMALEFPDARRGRAVAKALLSDDSRITTVAGIAHRGGPVLETQGVSADPANCGTFDPATSTAFCTVQEWLRLERAALGPAVSDITPGKTLPMIYVERPTGATAGRLEFDTFQGGADLKRIDLPVGASSQLQSGDAATATSLLGTCTGLTANVADIQAPDVANDGTRVAFAARNSATEPLGIWTVNIDGSSCTRMTPAVPDQNGLKVHNFDPAWSPDGQWIVFASTRGGSAGPVKSRKRMLPQSDIWRLQVATPATVEQMTYLSNSEVTPAFMREGRVTMTTEKVSDGFYQLSGRRINWDRTDYHPLLAQRAQSLYAFDSTDPKTHDLTAMKPSIDYASATDIREASDGDFLLILSDVGTDGAPVLKGGAGALGIFNRSIGPFEAGRNDPGYLQSLRLIDAGTATGRAGATAGYRAPSSMPDGTILASYADNLGTQNWQLVSVSPRDQSRRPLLTNSGGKAQVDAVLAVAYPARVLYDNRRQLVFGGSGDNMDAGHAILHMPDAPMVFTVLTGNLRRGRPVDAFRKASKLLVYSEDPCPASGCTANTNGIFQSREVLGSANLASDGSVRVQLPSGKGIILSLVDGNGKEIVTMTEEHQLGPGEAISMGVSEKLFDAVCGGCHGSVSGEELDIAVKPDALTGASSSMSATVTPTVIGN